MERSIETINTTLEKIRQQQQLLFSHAKQLKLTRESVKHTLEEICQQIAEVMACERVGIWLFNEKRTILTARNYYDATRHEQSSGECLFQQDMPTYFEAVQQGRTLMVKDVTTDPATEELYRKGYYDPKTQSMLDASIILSRGIGGVLCCETTEKREWSVFDQVIISALADMVAFIFDRIYRIEIEEHIHTLAYTDPLTGLDNQHAFLRNVDELLPNLPMDGQGVFLYLILDQFTEIQGVLGHDGGDEVLKETARRLRYLFPAPAITARIGFDHFIVFIPHGYAAETATLFMDRLADEIRRPMHIGGHEVYLTFSYGVSYYPEHVQTAKEGLQTAHVALQSGRKKKTRKAGRVYKPGMHTTMKEMMLSEINLRKGLDLNEFCLFYQPQVDGKTGELRGFEALIRWKHPERGLIYPGDFIDLAESTGLILPIGEWVIKEAFTQLRRWEDEGRGHLKVSINLSPRHFLHHTLPDYLIRCAEESGIEPNRLKLEITENVALQDQVAVKRRIKQLVDLGFDISIDDFGTGYSAFIYLQHFSVQEIKIDRQFIMDLTIDPKSSAIVQTIIRLAKMLGLSVIAEGVETEEQWMRLKQLGCTKIQGYYFSRPLPADEIDKLLEDTGGKLPVQAATADQNE
ncbi:sensor domain-containing phosphodiesterase [Sporosarcina sp. FSL W7-1349]|uniref:sensor domain-containing phosphodiesterase n=1 Tax=Sporosarcina sp. FSL W7-1349 TaxID=2921561 RepID=UPI0030F841CC